MATCMISPASAMEPQRLSALRVVVERGTTCIIKPTTATEPHRMFLSVYDIFYRQFHYMLTVFFYKLADRGPNAYEEAVERLKASLGKALVAYYPWAGRLLEQADGRLALECKDAGVEFVEASIDMSFSSLEEDDFQHKDFFKNFCTRAHIDEWTEVDLPLLSIQVTRFKGGEAMVLGVSSSHVIADGNSTFAFLKTWGECARGLDMSLPPIHMREELCIEKLIKPTINKEGLSISQGGRFCLIWPEHGVLIQYDFHFSSQTLMKLKHIANCGENTCSSFEALVAHIWKHLGMAKELKDSSDFGLSLVGDFRNRLIPSLPQAYFGNAIMRSHTKVKMGDLQRESFRDTVKRIKDVIKSFDDKAFREFGGAPELLPACDFLKEIDLDTPNLIIACSPKFPIYDVEFGWGKPSCIRSPRIRGDGDAFMWMGKEQDGSIDVSLALNVPTMEKLKLDSSFLFV